MPDLHRRQILVLIPGLDGTGVFLRPLVEALPSWIEPRVFAFNHLRPRAYADLLGELERFLADTPRFHVFAWSYSGPLAVMLAARSRQVQSLVLASSFVRNPRPELHALLGIANWPLIGAVRTIRRLPVWLGRRRSDPYRRAKAEVWAKVDSRDLATRLRTLPGIDVRGELARTTMPLLCMVASDDPVVPPASRDEIRAARPDVVLHEIDGPHFAVYFHAGEAAAAISAFLSGAAQGKCVRVLDRCTYRADSG